MGHFHLTTRNFLILCLCTLFLFSCKERKQGITPDPTQGVYVDTLTISPYLYVPRLDQFITVMQDQWYKIHPETFLEVVTKWDCYSEDPPDSIEVFVYDGIFFNYFMQQGFLTEIPDSAISEPADILPYALEAGKSGEKLFSLPQIGCGNILFYRKDDLGLAAANSYQAMLKSIGLAHYTGLRPPPGKGLLMDFSGGTTDACYYVGTDMQRLNFYSPVQPPQPDCQNLAKATLDSLNMLVKMEGDSLAAFGDSVAYMRAIWFGEGTGQATVGFTESLSAMNYTAEQVAFKPLPLGGAEFTPFYVDMVAINSKTNAKIISKAVELADLLSSSEYETSTFGPDTSGIPQYLMPIRQSVFDNLGTEFPLYREMSQMVKTANPKAFLLDANARNWLDGSKDCIRKAILNDQIPVFPGPKELKRR